MPTRKPVVADICRPPDGPRIALTVPDGCGHIDLDAPAARSFGLTIHYHNRRRLPADREAGATYHATLEGMPTR